MRLAFGIRPFGQSMGAIIFVDYPHDWILRPVLEYVVNRSLAFEHNDP